MICSTMREVDFVPQDRSAVQDRLAIQMRREEKEIVHIGLTLLAAAVRQQRARILQHVGAELADRYHVALPQEEPTVGALLEKLKDRPGRLHAVPVLGFHQEYGLAVLEQFDRTLQNI